MRAIALTLLILSLVAGCAKETPQAERGESARSLAGVAASAPVVLILGDGFLKAEEAAFDTVARMIEARIEKIGGQAGSLRVESQGDSLAGGPLVIGPSNDCYFKLGADALQRVRAHKPAGVDPKRYVVVVNREGKGNEGCAYGDVMFVVRNSTGDVVAHELGHSLAGLYDERGSDPATPPQVRSHNCSDTKDPLPWDASIGAKQNCNGYAKLWRPTDKCTMQSPAWGAFCKVCAEHVHCATSGVLGGCAPPGTPPLPPSLQQGATSGVDVIASIDGNQLRVIETRTVELATLSPLILTSDTFAVVYDGEQRVGVGSLSVEGRQEGGQAWFAARAYDSNGEERIVPVDTGLVRLTVVGRTEEEVRSGRMRLELETLVNGRQSFVLDEETFGRLSALPSTETGGWSLQ